MKAKAIVAAVFLAGALNAQAGDLIVHGRSYHSVGEHNNANYGLGYRFDSGYVVGYYYNSDRRNSFYAGYNWRFSEYASISVALATGYEYAVIPIVMPTLHIPLGYRVSLGVGAAPIRSGSEWGVLVHSMLNFKF